MMWYTNHPIKGKMVYYATYEFTTEKAAELAKQDYDNHKEYSTGHIVYARSTGMYEFDVWKK